MIFHARLGDGVAASVSGDPRRHDDGAVRHDLSHGWTLSSIGKPRQPRELRLIGDRFWYTARLDAYRLPAGLCICDKSSCVCHAAPAARATGDSSLKLISAQRRTADDGTARDVVDNERYDDELRFRSRSLEPRALVEMTARWTRVHASRRRVQADRDLHIDRWKLIVSLRAFLAKEAVGAVRLADPALDAEQLELGQLVLLAASEREAARADVDIVYTVPGLAIELRVEDQDEHRLVMDYGKIQDPVLVEEHLRQARPSDRCLVKDDKATDNSTHSHDQTLTAAAYDARLRMLVGRPKLARRTPLTAAEHFDKQLDKAQREAADAALEADELLVVQGPPGTGKTTFICETIRQHLALDRNARILLAAQTHQAVDNVLKRLAAADTDLAIVRLGGPRVRLKIDALVRERFWIENPEPWVPRVRMRALAYRRMAEAQLAAGDVGDEQDVMSLLDIQEEYLRSDGDQRAPDARLRAARVVAGTCASVGGKLLRDQRFTVAILEEAGKATPPEALAAILKAQKSVLIGDSRQLPPHVSHALRGALRDPATISSSDPERQNQARSLATKVAKLGATAQAREACAEETLLDHLAARLAGTGGETTLRTQYRMVPAIGALISDVFYGEVLEHARPSDLSDRDARVASFAGATQVRMLDVPGRQQSGGGKGKSSNIRREELVQIRRELADLQLHAARHSVAHGPMDPLGVAVITPYSAQVKLLRGGIDATHYPDLRVRLGIVDASRATRRPSCS